jgi:hypothetical protein
MCRMLLIALLAALPLAAHHSAAAEFDITKPVTLKGVVTKAEWINPHAWLHMDVKDADGNVVQWLVELAAPLFLKRAGVTEESFQQAGEVTVEVWLAKDGTRRAGARQGGKLILASGQNVTLPNVTFSRSGKDIVFAPAAAKK